MPRQQCSCRSLWKFQRKKETKLLKLWVHCEIKSTLNPHYPFFQFISIFMGWRSKFLHLLLQKECMRRPFNAHKPWKLKETWWAYLAVGFAPPLSHTHTHTHLNIQGRESHQVITTKNTHRAVKKLANIQEDLGMEKVFRRLCVCELCVQGGYCQIAHHGLKSLM